MKANGNFSDASLERFYSVSINCVMSLRNVHKNNIIGPSDAVDLGCPVKAYLIFRCFTDKFSQWCNFVSNSVIYTFIWCIGNDVIFQCL